VRGVDADAVAFGLSPQPSIKSRVSRGRASLERAMAAAPSAIYVKPERVDGMAEIEGHLDRLKRRDSLRAPCAESV